MKNDLDSSIPEDSLGPNDSLVYLKLEHTPAWAQQHTHHQSQELFTRSVFVCLSVRKRGESAYNDEYDFVKMGEFAIHPFFFASMISFVTVSPAEICCYGCCQDLSWWWRCAIRPRICFVQLCSFTNKTLTGNKAYLNIHAHIQYTEKYMDTHLLCSSTSKLKEI